MKATYPSVTVLLVQSDIAVLGILINEALCARARKTNSRGKLHTIDLHILRNFIYLFSVLLSVT